MRKGLAAAVLFTLLGVGNAHATNLAVISQPPTILNLVVLVIACVATLVCIQVSGAVKGGQLSRAWQMFMTGFGVLALSQIAMLLDTFEIVALPLWIAPLLMAVCLGLLAYGVFEAKRILA